MQEYLSEAVVLNSYPAGDLDLRLSVFTKRFGKLTAKVKSARKITSKLAGHLQPGDLVRIRLVEKGGLQAVDALKQGRIEVPPPDLALLDRILHEGGQELRLWQMLADGAFSWPEALHILGWDPAEASCVLCGRRHPEVFRPRDQEFFCGNCALKLGRDEIILIGK